MKTSKNQPNKNPDLLFERFSKGKVKAQMFYNNCVIYTRVSTKEQADNNMSLETQRKACEEYAVKQGYNILGHFGGTYESAKTDERKQFNAMLSFVRKSKEKVGFIIVYSIDRFSRSGANAIYIKEQLKQQGIALISVTQLVDSTTASGALQQNIQIVFSEYDNQLRRDKCVAGMREKLLSGGWIGSPPAGYDIVQRDGKKAIVLNAKGKLVAKAFAWRAQGMSNEDVRMKLAMAGWKLPNQRVSDMLRNPFYCGVIAHSILEGKTVEGSQEKAVSKELFLQVNGLLEKNGHGYSLKPENDEVPLKKFVRCTTCDKPLTAYKAKKNQQYYYKCSTMGCKCNRLAKDMHKAFKVLIIPYQFRIDGILREILERQMLETYYRFNADKALAQQEMNKRLQESKRKLERLEERFVAEEIDAEMFAKYREKFREETKEIEAEMAKAGNQLSNPEKCIAKCLQFASELASLWDLSDYGEKQRLQSLLFPDGISYDRKNDTYRTGRVNAVFSYMSSVARVLAKKKSGETNSKIDFPASVVWAGIEPATHGFSVLVLLVSFGAI